MGMGRDRPDLLLPSSLHRNIRVPPYNDYGGRGSATMVVARPHNVEEGKGNVSNTYCGIYRTASISVQRDG